MLPQIQPWTYFLLEHNKTYNEHHLQMYHFEERQKTKQTQGSISKLDTLGFLLFLLKAHVWLIKLHDICHG